MMLEFILGVVMTEAITEIVVKSEIFIPIKKLIFGFGKNNNFFKWVHNLLDCGYCFSVWAGVLSSILLFYKTQPLLNTLIIGIVLHRFSNILHNLIDKTKDKDL